MRPARALVLTLALLAAPPALAEDRVADARARRGAEVARLLAAAGLPAEVDVVYLRAFKEERELELWAGLDGHPLAHVKTYPFCAASGTLGPKRREGDLQVPEGLYEVDLFNPVSSFHLSMRVSYPNASDRRRGDPARPGGDIYVHGACASIGCIAIEDGPIEEVYLIARGARRRPRIDIFPARLDAGWLARHADHPDAGLWAELAPAVAAFEARRRPPRFTVDPRTGAYRVRAAGPDR